jgi:hypothetical protein
VNVNRQQVPSSLFLVRVWPGDTGDAESAQSSWCGRVQHVVTGEAHTFYDWQTLTVLMARMLDGSQSENRDVKRTRDA